MIPCKARGAHQWTGIKRASSRRDSSSHVATRSNTSSPASATPPATRNAPRTNAGTTPWHLPWSACAGGRSYCSSGDGGQRGSPRAPARRRSPYLRYRRSTRKPSVMVTERQGAKEQSCADNPDVPRGAGSQGEPGGRSCVSARSGTGSIRSWHAQQCFSSRQSVCPVP